MAKVAIIGTGFIGRAWAISFGRAGHDITFWDADPAAADAALAYIETVLPDLAANDLLNGLTPAEMRSRMRGAARIEDALGNADHVQENTPEKVDVKREVFSILDRYAPPGAVIASSTSAILPSKFTEHLPGRARCLVIHPINPPYLIPAAEVVPAPWTSAETVARARDFLIGAGHAPIVMKRELDGFVMNRMQGVLMEEAFRLVADGYATVEDVDIGIRDGLALRWSFMGPFETIDLNAPGGIRDYVERYQGIYERLHPSQQRRVDWNGPVLDEIERDRRKRLPADQLEKRQRWRDRRLMALAAQKKKAARDIGS
jgi:3-hydroxyacyl-CoA dehydrogenase